MVGDRPGAFGRGFGEHSRDVARAPLGRLESLGQQAREALEPLVEIADLAVDLIDDRVERFAALREHLFSMAVAGVDLLRGGGKRLALRFEPFGRRSNIAQDCAGTSMERFHLLFEARVHRAAALADLVHRGDELRNAAGQRRLDRTQILRRTAHHLLQQYIRLAQPLEQRRGVVTQHAMRFHHLGHGGRGGLLRTLDRPACRRIELRDGTADLGARLGARIVDLRRDALAGLGNRLGECDAFRVDRLHGLMRDALELGRELLALCTERAQERAGLLVQHAPQVVATLIDVGGQLFGLRRHAARDLGAHAEQRAFHLAGILLQCRGHSGRDRGQCTLGFAGATLDRTGHLARDRRNLARRLIGASAQRFASCRG